MFVRYRKPVPINRELALSAVVEDEKGRRVHVRGELRDGNEVLAETRIAFVHVSLEHFLGTPEGQAIAEAFRARER
jgi:acyl-CoA thioesterase FadM